MKKLLIILLLSLSACTVYQTPSPAGGAVVEPVAMGYGYPMMGYGYGGGMMGMGYGWGYGGGLGININKSSYNNYSPTTTNFSRSGTLNRSNSMRSVPQYRGIARGGNMAQSRGMAPMSRGGFGRR